MKKKIICISVIVVIVFVFSIFGRGIYFYGKYMVPDKSYFGNQYNEILHPMSVQDKKQATEIMKMIDEAFSFIGKDTDAKNKFKALSRYCVSEAYCAVSEEHSLKLITADFDETKGYLWFVYDQEAFTGSGKKAMGSWDILVRATLEKSDKGWTVVDTKEHP